MTTYNIVISKINEPVELRDLPESSLAYALEYGLRQSVNDAHASVQRKAFATDAAFAAAVREAAMKRVTQLREGTIHLRAASVDPLAAKIRELAAAQGMSADDWVAMVTAAPKKTKAA